MDEILKFQARPAIHRLGPSHRCLKPVNRPDLAHMQVVIIMNMVVLYNPKSIRVRLNLKNRKILNLDPNHVGRKVEVKIDEYNWNIFSIYTI